MPRLWKCRRETSSSSRFLVTCSLDVHVTSSVTLLFVLCDGGLGKCGSLGRGPRCGGERRPCTDPSQSFPGVHSTCLQSHGSVTPAVHEDTKIAPMRRGHISGGKLCLLALPPVGSKEPRWPSRPGTWACGFHGGFRGPVATGEAGHHVGEHTAPDLSLQSPGSPWGEGYAGRPDRGLLEADGDTRAFLHFCRAPRPWSVCPVGRCR
ncbi:uncharacterized protein LOC125082690 [Lutra lutra]|uniref:uncharacterized protein LOC125082690 n=1 Tax=Lutra lutra TaxID=9657 RepID=UPI001FD09931|nr:uncharacterized protein LOC125082690 [Lutra lutra]